MGLGCKSLGIQMQDASYRSCQGASPSAQKGATLLCRSLLVFQHVFSVDVLIQKCLVDLLLWRAPGENFSLLSKTRASTATSHFFAYTSHLWNSQGSTMTLHCCLVEHRMHGTLTCCYHT